MAVGSSPQQHRLSTGMFASKLCSSGWTPGSSGRARKNGHKSELSKTNYSWISFVFKILVIIVVVLLPSNLAQSPSFKPVPTKSGTYSSQVKDQFVGLGQRNSSIQIKAAWKSGTPEEYSGFHHWAHMYDQNHVTLQQGTMMNPGVDFTNCLFFSKPQKYGVAWVAQLETKAPWARVQRDIPMPLVTYGVEHGKATLGSWPWLR